MSTGSMSISTRTAIRDALLATPHTRLPVAEGSVDAVIGVVQARDIAAALFRGEPLDLRRLMRQAPVLPDQVDAMDALGALRRAEVPMGLVHDEYGHFEGHRHAGQSARRDRRRFRVGLRAGRQRRV